MSGLSRYDAHPDEHTHVEAGEYYMRHWLPPIVGDQGTLDSYSVYGYSYLNELDTVYFFAGKVAAALEWLPVAEYRLFRLFNLLLLAALLVWSIRGTDSARLVLLPIALSPQVWYLFSYFNADALPLALSFIAAGLAAGHLQRLETDTSPHRWTVVGAVGAGVVLGLLVLAKKNYLVFVAFVVALLFALETATAAALGLFWGAVLVYVARYLIAGPNTALVTGGIGLAAAGGILAARALWRSAPPLARVVAYAVVAVVAALLVGPRLALDRTLGGDRTKDAAILEMAGKLAQQQYQVSRSGTPDEGKPHPGLRLAERGIGFGEIFRAPYHWPVHTAISAMGLYGYMNIRSPATYYLLLGLAFCVLFGHVMWRALREPGPARAAALLAISCATVLLLLSAFTSWKNDFQPQGRYLFPVLAMFGAVAALAARRLDLRVVAGAASIAFVLSCYSFAAVGLAQIPKTF